MDKLTLTIMSMQQPLRPVRFHDEPGVWIHAVCAMKAQFAANNADQLVEADKSEPSGACWFCMRCAWTF